MSEKKLKNILRKQISKIYSYSKIYYECNWLNSFLKYNSIDLVLDVGANSGQYALSLRRFGYKNKIISFEPGSDAYLKLIQNAKNDSKWNIYEKVGLGNQKKNIKLNISENSVSSSFKSIKKLHLLNQPDSKYIKTEKTKIVNLDEVFKKFCKTKENIMLKIDKNDIRKSSDVISAINKNGVNKFVKITIKRNNKTNSWYNYIFWQCT